MRLKIVIKNCSIFCNITNDEEEGVAQACEFFILCRVKDESRSDRPITEKIIKIHEKVQQATIYMELGIGILLIERFTPLAIKGSSMNGFLKS